MRGALVLAVAAAATAGCSSQWYSGFSKQDIARTDVVVQTTPPGATVYFNDRKQSAVTPIRIPVEYTHVVTLWERQNNYGARMREDMHPIVAVLTFPVWALASLIHYHEEMQRHTYGGNVHTVATWIEGYDDTQQTITLEGEADHPVDLTLRRTGPEPAQR